MALTRENHPNPFTDENGFAIIAEIAKGMSAEDASAIVGRSRSAFFEWMDIGEAKGRTDIADAYKRARRGWARATADKILEIADDDSNDAGAIGNGNMAAVKRSDLRIKTRLWLLERYNKSDFGDSHDITTGGDKIGGGPVFVLHDPAAKDAVQQVINAVAAD